MVVPVVVSAISSVPASVLPWVTPLTLASASSIRDGAERSGSSPVLSMPGLEKNPSVNSADVPSSTCSVDTPSQVTESGAERSAAGRVNRSA